MDRHDALLELARRARVDRSYYIAEGLSDLIVATRDFVRGQLTRPDEFSGVKALRTLPAHQR